ncbi:type II secretion system F family protein [Paludifilum halophilum]|uniref:Type II secretion system protein GspF domain-containing protein n=1 Tax=Paludifilum halophilum TaxID=1642702 RepID=A0A235B6A2_9BACL|nr:type II secretion system F family protein [Paludifilum halophilum]OYD07761.1 hypothetical protein CHM34_09830 [Paludifilum halophilum]
MRKTRWTDDRLVLFGQHLANLLESGFPLMPSIHLLTEQQVLRREESDRICRCLDEGRSLSEALARERLPPLFVSFMKAAEEHGDYIFGLKQCETYYRERGKLIRDLAQAMTYPAVVLILVGGAFLFLITTVIPRFHDMYETMGITLPLYTQILISLYGSVRYVLYGIAAVLCLCVLFYLVLRRLPSDKRGSWTRWMYRMPVARKYFALRFTHYFAIQMGSLLRSGVPLLRTVEIVNSLTPWFPLAAGIWRIRERLLAGQSLNRSLEAEGDLFLPSLSRLVALGEESGRLDQSLLTLAQGTEIVIRERMYRVTRSLEPILIFVIGVFMAATVLALFLPMLNLVRAL